MVSEQQKHPAYAETLTEVEADSTLAELRSERSELVAQKQALTAEWTRLKELLPAKYQERNSRQCSLASVHHLEAEVYEAKRAINSCRQALARCDLLLAQRQASLAQALVDAMGPELPALEARRAALLDLRHQSENRLRTLPAEMGALARQQDEMDFEAKVQAEKYASRIESEEQRRIAYAS